MIAEFFKELIVGAVQLIATLFFLFFIGYVIWRKFTRGDEQQ